ncbi:hypothetical protein LTS18_010145, partial [Coniosporium uncinatum]
REGDEKGAAAKNPMPPSGNNSAYVSNFEFVGTIDNSPFLCVPEAIEWRRQLGGEEKIREYCFRLARDGGEMIARRFGTEVLENEEGTLGKCCLTNVRLPIEANQVAAAAGLEEAQVAGMVVNWMQRTIDAEWNTFIATFFYAGHWWTRLSAQVYLEMKDFEFAADILEKVCARAENGEFAQWAKSRL